MSSLTICKFPFGIELGHRLYGLGSYIGSNRSISPLRPRGIAARPGMPAAAGWLQGRAVVLCGLMLDEPAPPLSLERSAICPKVEHGEIAAKCWSDELLGMAAEAYM